MNRVQELMRHAERHCQKNGVRLTEKRKRVLSGLLQSDKALSAYELVDYCKANFNETIPAMSVYRILNLLTSEQLVHKLNLANKYVACAHIAGEHKHETVQFLICGQCQRVKEIVMNPSIVEQLRRNVEEAGFHLTSPQLEINCVCDNCKANAA